jgi:hypothetical protein
MKKKNEKWRRRQFTNKLNLRLRKKLMKCYTINLFINGAEINNFEKIEDTLKIFIFSGG